jgi:hypothetical protein
MVEIGHASVARLAVFCFFTDLKLADLTIQISQLGFFRQDKWVLVVGLTFSLFGDNSVCWVGYCCQD